jgi:hypothetical protein
LNTLTNKKTFYYNELSRQITNDIFDNLKLGIKYDQTQYDWPYDLSIDDEEDTDYFNFTFWVDKIPKEHFIKNDIMATSGPDEYCMPHIKIQMLLEKRKWIKKHDYTYAQIIGVVAHELHHLTQNFSLSNYNPTSGDYADYFLDPIEIEAFHIGFRAESDHSNKTIEECIKNYLNDFLEDDRITRKQYENIIVKWLNPKILLLKGVK